MPHQATGKSTANLTTEQRRLLAAYERVRVKIIEDIEILLRGHSMSLQGLGRKLGWSAQKTRQVVYEKDLKLSEAVALMFCFGLDFYPVMRPIRPLPLTTSKIPPQLSVRIPKRHRVSRSK